jgi:hypothetical protein
MISKAGNDTERVHCEALHALAGSTWRPLILAVTVNVRDRGSRRFQFGGNALLAAGVAGELGRDG